jgi:hypothetical protein
MPMILFGGLLSNNKEQLAWISWLQYISPIKYGAEALLDIELMNDKYTIRENMMDFLDYKIGYLNCIWILLALIICFRLIAFFTFKMLIRKFQ